MRFLQGLSGVWYWILLLCIAAIIDLFVTLHYRALSLGLIRQTIVYSVIINVLATLTAAWVILSLTIWPLVFETVGVAIGTYVGMRLRIKR